MPKIAILERILKGPKEDLKRPKDNQKGLKKDQKIMKGTIANQN